jgi:hypothetical protein
MIPEIKNILEATDLSKNASYAFFYAIDMAKDITQKLSFYILLDLFVMCTLKKCLVAF